MNTSIKIGVYGLGRFGTIWERELARHGYKVYGYGRSAKQAPEGVSLVSEDDVLDCDVLFYCVAISAFEEVLKRTAPRITAKTLVMDTCSVKLYPAKLMREHLGADVPCIATHPMFGPDSGKDGITGLPLVICAVNAHDSVVQQWVEEFARWGLQVHRMSCDQHDREAAWSQGITHFVGDPVELSLWETNWPLQDRSITSIVEQTCNDPLVFYDCQVHPTPEVYGAPRVLSIRYADFERPGV